MKRPWRSLFLIALIMAAGARAAFAQAPSFPACANGGPALNQFSVCEVVMQQTLYTDEGQAYTVPAVKGVFKHKNASTGQYDKQLTVYGFYDKTGNDIVFKIRFNMSLAGKWDYTADCTKQADGLPCGANAPGASGTFDVNASSARGFLRSDDFRTTKYIYDQPSSPRFHPFLWGQTYYQIVNKARGGYTALWHEAVTQSASKGMNKIRLLVTSWDGDPDRQNPESKAFLKKVNSANLDRDKLDIKHWQALDEVTWFLDSQGIIADLILFHDGGDTSSPYAGTRTSNPDPCTSVSSADQIQNRRYTRYVVARYAAFSNVIWTLSNEYQLVTGPSGQGRVCSDQWNELACIITGRCTSSLFGADPWFASLTNAALLRPLSNHNNINTVPNASDPKPVNYNYPCFEFFDESWATHVALQTQRPKNPERPFADGQAANPVLLNRNVFAGGMNPCAGSGNRPVVNDEYYYVGQEKNNGQPTDRDWLQHRQATWAIAASGGYGSTGSLHGPDNCAACQPSLYTVWVEEPRHYGDIKAVTNFFGNILKDLWWQMSPTAKVAPIDAKTRVYGLEGPNRQYVIYAVRQTESTEKRGRYNVTLRKGMYSHFSYDPRNTATAPKKETKKVSQNNLTVQFMTPKPAPNTPLWEDWAERIFPQGAAIPPPPDKIVAEDDTDTDTAWVWDVLPAGAIPAGVSEGWNWIEEEPVPISDSLAHQSNNVPGAMHQHYFYGATETLAVGTGDILYAYVYLDPVSTPSEVMLQWNDGTWEHRAYWGANQIGWGTDGTNSRRYMGPLPTPGQWVRLEVPASAVGLEGHTLNGMAFTLFGGQATWDEAGKAGQPAPVCDPGVITLQPQSQTIIPGASANLSVDVSGTGSFQYQFYQGPTGTLGTPIGISTPTINTGPLTKTTQYWAQIVDTCVGVLLDSDTATITVQCTAAPAITVQPTSRVTTPGQSTTLSVSATQAVSYQWYQGNSPSTATPISGATYPTLTVAPQSTTNYWARVTNGCGLADSVTATVCVLPKITAQPTPRTINPGQSTTLSVSAINAASYQWYVGDAPSTAAPVAGGTGSSLLVAPSVTTNYWVRVTNSCGFVDSTTVTVTVAPAPPPQITRIQSKSVLANSQNSITANWPQPTQPGTFLVAVISGLKDPAQLQWTAPAGWQLAIVQEFSSVKLAIYYLPNNAGARTSETFTVQMGYHDMTLYVLEYSGMMAVNPLDRIGAAGDFTNNGYVQTGFTANTVQPKELVITALSTYTQTEFSVTPADGYAEIYDQYMLFHLTTAMYEKITTATGSYGHGATVYVPAEWAGVVATFRGANTN